MKKILYLTLLSAFTLQASKAQDKKMERIQITDNMQPVNPEWFTGTGWLEMLVTDTDTFGSPSAMLYSNRDAATTGTSTPAANC